MSKEKNFSDEYKLRCREAWYLADRPTGVHQIKAIIPFAEDGRKPSVNTIQQWKYDQGWDAWSEDLRAKALVVREDLLIQETVKMLSRQAEVGREVMEKAFAHLQNEGFDTSASAVAAIKLGAELERTSRGIGETFAQVAKMNNDELREEIIKRLTQASESGQIVIDAQEVDTVSPESETETPTE